MKVKETIMKGFAEDNLSIKNFEICDTKTWILMNFAIGEINFFRGNQDSENSISTDHKNISLALKFAS